MPFWRVLCPSIRVPIKEKKMTCEFYKKHTERFFKGRKVKTNKEIRNGYVVIPAGRCGTITGKSRGFWIQFDRCPACGIAALFSRVRPEQVELIDGGDK
jgi:hypothetical protein